MWNHSITRSLPYLCRRLVPTVSKQQHQYHPKVYWYSLRTTTATTATTTPLFDRESYLRNGPLYRNKKLRFLAVVVTTTTSARLLSSVHSLPLVRTFASTGGIPTQTTTTTITTTMEEVKVPSPTLVSGITVLRPNLPFRYYEEDTMTTEDTARTTPRPTLDLSELSQQISVTYQQKQNMYEISRNIQNSIQQIRSRIGTDVAQQEIQQLLETYSTINHENHNDNSIHHNNGATTAVLTHDKATNRVPRLANLSYTVEDIMRTISYQHFLQTGRVTVPPPYATDEEYVSGAIMGLCSDLQQYGLGRATVRDTHSVQMACHVVTACMEYLLSFDFRNGPLRRRYDGCKYSLKALETFLYELAVTSPSTSISDPSVTVVQPTLVLEDILPMKELMALKERMEFRDELRETLIKKCRDGQKLAKQCIFALHRNHTDRMTPQTLLQQCSKYIQEDLFPIVQEEPPLRYGSFASVLEEYVEAKLFYTWLHGRDENTVVTTSVSPDTTSIPAHGTVVSGIILVPQDFMMDEFIQLQPEEYIGGLCDLTGEIGRFAVQRGTVRDVASIKQCLYSNTIIYNAIQGMDRISSSNGGGGGSSSKKLDTVRNNVQKIERMLYEISLSEAAGHGRTIHTEAPITTPAVTGGADED